MPDDVLAEALAHAARSLNRVSSLEETLTEIVRTTLLSVPGADHVGVSLAHPDGRLDTLAATSDRVHEFDGLQHRLREGPCVFAGEADTVVHVPDVRTERRWPAYMTEARRRGLRAQIGVRLYAERHGQSSLNIYSEQEDGLDDTSAQAADLFAAQAALAMGKARAIDQLQEGMRSRQRIGVAVGLLMQRYETSEERAFAFLVRASSHGNVKLRDVAAEVVREFELGIDEAPGTV
ncbi:GAF and ANTAR domain-containing protein [Nocardioides sp. P5_C9_2]